jgi:hypothetical protein
MSVESSELAMTVHIMTAENPSRKLGVHPATGTEVWVGEGVTIESQRGTLYLTREEFAWMQDLQCTGTAKEDHV